MADKNKRPKKESTVNFLLSQFSCLVSKVPGVTPETVKAQIQHGNYYLFEGEIDKVAEALPENQRESFKEMLKFAEAVRSGSAPRLGEGITRIDSRERALEVANDPSKEENITKIMEYAAGLKALKDKLAPYIDQKAEVSLAFKNKKKAKKKAEETADVKSS